MLFILFVWYRFFIPQTNRDRRRRVAIATNNQAMKHGFIFETNIFLSSENTVSYQSKGKTVRFLEIISFQKNPSQNSDDDALLINAHISLSDDRKIDIVRNKLSPGTELYLSIKKDRILLFRPGSDKAVLDIFQLNERSFKSFAPHIKNAVAFSPAPGHLVTIKGDSTVSEAFMLVDDERLFINGVIWT